MKRNFSLILNEADDPALGGGDSGGGAGSPQVVDPQNQPGGDDSGVEPQPGATPAQPAPPQVDLETLRQVVDITRQQSTAPQAPAQMTQEEMDKALNVYRVNEELVNTLFNEEATVEQRMSALQAMLDGNTKHITTMMSHANSILQNNLTEQFQPALTMAEERQLSDYVTNIESQYPGLKGKGHIIRQVVDNLKQQGYQARTDAEADRTVAAHTEHLIKTIDPSFSLQAQTVPQVQQQQQTPAVPQMAALNGGSSGGGADSQGSSNNTPARSAIWQK